MALFHFAQVFSLVSDQLVWPNGKHPLDSQGPIRLFVLKSDGSEINWQTERSERNRQMKKETDRQTDRQTD